MTAARRRGPTRLERVRRGVTLLEVLLVLALLVVLAATAWPAMEPALAGYTLRKAADQVRVKWSRCRVEALSTGRTVLFRYEPEGYYYRFERMAEPDYAPASAAGAASVDLTGAEAGADTYAQTGSEAAMLTETDGDVFALPEHITFGAGLVEDDLPVGASVDTSSIDFAVDAAAGGDGQWSAPILFYPDGSTSTARLEIVNDRGQSIEISLRGLTGVVSVSEITRTAETSL